MGKNHGTCEVLPTFTWYINYAYMNIFRRPFPHNTSWQSAIITAFVFGAFVSLFLLVFRPFELEKVDKSLMVKSSLVFGLVTFCCIFTSYLFLNFFFPTFYSEEKWTTGKQIGHMAAIVILVGLVNYLISPLLFNSTQSWVQALYYQGIAISVGFLPIIIYTLYKQNHWLHQFKQEAAALQKKLDEKRGNESPDLTNPVSVSKETLTFESDNQAEKKTIEAGQLYYIEAASNYIKIFFEERGKLTYFIVRMTMKRAAETVFPHSAFFRCHRAYIVNLDKIEQVEGNAQGYKIKLRGMEDHIPVSRNLNREFSDRLLAFRQQAAP